jgi:hypothetical protein
MNWYVYNVEACFENLSSVAFRVAAIASNWIENPLTMFLYPYLQFFIVMQNIQRFVIDPSTITSIVAELHELEQTFQHHKTSILTEDDLKCQLFTRIQAILPGTFNTMNPGITGSVLHSEVKFYLWARKVDPSSGYSNHPTWRSKRFSFYWIQHVSNRTTFWAATQ